MCVGAGKFNNVFNNVLQEGILPFVSLEFPTVQFQQANPGSVGEHRSFGLRLWSQRFGSSIPHGASSAGAGLDDPEGPFQLLQI